MQVKKGCTPIEAMCDSVAMRGKVGEDKRACLFALIYKEARIELEE